MARKKPLFPGLLDQQLMHLGGLGLVKMVSHVSGG
jgi:hypothetical protein